MELWQLARVAKSSSSSSKLCNTRMLARTMPRTRTYKLLLQAIFATATTMTTGIMAAVAAALLLAELALALAAAVVRCRCCQGQMSLPNQPTAFGLATQTSARHRPPPRGC